MTTDPARLAAEKCSSRLPKPVAPRFWRYVNKTDDCWLWTGTRCGRRSFQYGQLSVNNRRARVHRLSWEMHCGPIPAGKWVLHRCDNPLCVRPDHLFLGDHEVNTMDMVRKGRHRPPSFPGEKNGSAKLTEADVLDIRARVLRGETQQAVADRHGISRGQIYNIMSGRSWFSLPWAAAMKEGD